MLSIVYSFVTNATSIYLYGVLDAFSKGLLSLVKKCFELARQHKSYGFTLAVKFVVFAG